MMEFWILIDDPNGNYKILSMLITCYMLKTLNRKCENGNRVYSSEILHRFSGLFVRSKC